MCRYVQSAESLGVDLIVNQCSSVGEAFAIASRCTAIPTLRVDEPMAEKAVSLGTRLGVIATVASTVKPSCDPVSYTHLGTDKITLLSVGYMLAKTIEAIQLKNPVSAVYDLFND